MPIDVNGKISDLSRLKSSIPTINFLLEQEILYMIIISHFCNPIPCDLSEKYSLGRFQDIIRQTIIENIKQDIVTTNNTTCSNEKFAFITSYPKLDIETLIEQVQKCIILNPNCKIFLLENLRLYRGEYNNDKEFAYKLSNLADFYINDAFSCCHRKHASIVGIPQIMKGRSYAGLSMMNEIQNLEYYVLNPIKQRMNQQEEEKKLQNEKQDKAAKKYLAESDDSIIEKTVIKKAIKKDIMIITAIIGGKKISTKLPLLYNLCNKVDYIIIVGALANTFLKTEGHDIGTSYYEENMMQDVRKLHTLGNFILPMEVVCTSKIINNYDNYSKKNNNVRKQKIWNRKISYQDFDDINNNIPVFEYKKTNIIKTIIDDDFSDNHGGTLSCNDIMQNNILRADYDDSITEDYFIADIGLEAIEHINSILYQSDLVLWSGPAGCYEVPDFAIGTKSIASTIARLTREGKLLSVLGGGDTIAAVNGYIPLEYFSYCSTAGGAFLSWLQNPMLPGIAALYKCNNEATIGA